MVDCDHSIRARLLPEYSSTIASWTIVSSRWVAGLSNGSLPVSARMMMKKRDQAEEHARSEHDARLGGGADQAREVCPAEGEGDDEDA